MYVPSSGGTQSNAKHISQSPSATGTATPAMAVFVPVVARDAAARDRVFSRADGRIEVRAYYEPLHFAPAFEGLPRLGALTVTEDIGSRIISLPMAVDLADDVIADVVAVVTQAALA